MSYYIKQKCGSCKKSLTGGYVGNYSGIGQPFIVCERCGIPNNNSDRVTEWKLKSEFSKIIFVIHHMISIVFFYGGGAGIAGAVMLGKAVISSLTGFIILVTCSVAFGLLRFFVRLGRAIRDSDVRMGDADYVSKLKFLGLTR